MSRQLSPVGLPFTDTAPLRLVFAREVSATPDAVFHALAEDVAGWPAWYAAVTSVRPLGNGTGREVRLKGGARLRETVLVAKSPETYAYRVDETNAPGVRALLEEWRLTPGTTGGTRVQWTFAADGSAPFRLALRLGRAGLGRAFREAMTALDRRLASAPA